MCESVHEELGRLKRELDFRMAVTEAILGTLELDRILYAILSGITSGDGLGFNRAFLFLDDAKGRALELRLAVGPASRDAALKIWEEIEAQRVGYSALLPRFEAFHDDADCQALTRRFRRFSLPLNRLDALARSPEESSGLPLSVLLARALVSRGPIVCNGCPITEHLEGPSGEPMQLMNTAVVPLVVGERLIGAIVADNYYSSLPVSPETLRSLAAIGNLAALAIDRSRMHAKTAAMAEIDGLTGVYNRRHYENELHASLEVSGRTRQPLSIIVFDLDNFKHCNDQFGHTVGDEVLKDVAKILVEDVRQSDMVARYGGEEFVLLLKNTTAESAMQVADKLCRTVRQARLGMGRVASLTISAGVTSTIGDEGSQELFARADAALYEAKDRGRDHAVLWQPGPRETWPDNRRRAGNQTESTELLSRRPARNNAR